MPESTVNAALNYYSAVPETFGFFEYLAEHPVVLVLGVICIILLVVLLVFIRRVHTLKKPAE